MPSGNSSYLTAPLIAGLGLGASAVTAGALSTIPIDYSTAADAVVAPVTEDIGGLLAPEDVLAEFPDIVSFSPFEEGGIEYLGSDLSSAEIDSFLLPESNIVTLPDMEVPATFVAESSLAEVGAAITTTLEIAGDALAAAFFM